MLDKIKAWFKNSVTILWARLWTLAGLALGVVTMLSADPNTMAALQAAIPAKYWWIVMVMIGLLTELARRRTVDKPTNAANQVIG